MYYLSVCTWIKEIIDNKRIYSLGPYGTVQWQQKLLLHLLLYVYLMCKFLYLHIHTQFTLNGLTVVHYTYTYWVSGPSFTILNRTLRFRNQLCFCPLVKLNICSTECLGFTTNSSSVLLWITEGMNTWLMWCAFILLKWWGSFICSYVCLGRHSVAVILDGEPVKGSPFACNIYDVSKVKITGLGSSKVQHTHTVKADFCWNKRCF
jgi:hypothetical protein